MTIAATGLPFDDIRKLMQDLPVADLAAVAQCKARDAQLTKPPGSLGKLETMAEWVAAWQGNYPPKIARPVVAVFAGNHGVVAQGVAAYPAEVTKQMVLNFQGGGAAINQICKTFDLGLKVFELALENPTKDITQEAAMDEADCAATMAYGMEAIAGGCDLLCIGEMGIGNTTIAAAICHGLYGGKPEDWVGPGTGVDAEGLKRKASAVARAVALHKAHLSDPLEVLRRLGGRELAAMAGAILAARTQRVPVLIDGYVAIRRRRRAPRHAARRARPLPRGALFGRTRAPQSAQAAGQGTGPRSRHAAGRSLGCSPRRGAPQGGGQPPQRHGHLRQRRRLRQGRIGTAKRRAVVNSQLRADCAFN